ncbi:hypothetical protein LE191_12430 [Janthinobacterium sp. HSC-3S05]|uniref:hypothetical protein n=1 Tax=Janthinobacterium lividum TaxID=29581 RepID=UPI001CD8719A|nr:hypothetical protein [Janthinobacterium lividum]MCA1860909.1 hypothetical protein [Janthinobacterium lividum]
MDTSPSTDDFLWNERLYVLAKAETSSLYHRKRERFFALCDRLSKASSLIAGTAAFSSLVATAEAKSVAGLFVAISTLPGLVLAWNDRARLHAELAQKYLIIEAEIALAGKRNFTEDQLNGWLARLITIEISEPPTLTVLIAYCYNQILITNDRQNEVIEISFWQRFFMHICDMDFDWISPSRNKK